MTEPSLTDIASKLDTLLQRVDAATGDGKLTLAFIATQQERLLEEMGQIRDDLRVAAAMVQRLDGAMQGLVNEVRAEHGRYDRLERRVAKLEPAFPSPAR